MASMVTISGTPWNSRRSFRTQGDLVAFLGDSKLAEHQPGAVGEHRHQMRGGRTHPPRAAQRLAIHRDCQQPGRLGSHRGKVRAQAPVQVGRIELGEHRPERLLARMPEPNPQTSKYLWGRCGCPTGEPSIAAHPRRGGQDRDRQQPGQRIPTPTPVPRVRHRRQHLQELRAEHFDALSGTPAIQRLRDRRYG